MSIALLLLLLYLNSKELYIVIGRIHKGGELGIKPLSEISGKFLNDFEN